MSSETGKSTEDLENTLKSTHAGSFHSFLDKNQGSLISGGNPFGVWLKEKLKEKGITQQQLFVRADIPEGYGYKLLSGEKKTRQRDVLYRLCYAAGLSVGETARGFRLYGLMPLYARDPRDALLIICLNERPGSVIDVSELLRKEHFDTLRTSGVQN